MNAIIKNEGDRVMRTITKRVLGNFWRHYTTADAETQTYDKAIEVLKAAIKNLEKIADPFEVDPNNTENLIKTACDY